jgi:ATP-binding cassette, subfamily B, bacterial PglK
MNQNNSKTLFNDHFSLLVRLWRLISSRRRQQLAFLLIIMLLTSIADVASIGAVLPFLGVLISPEIIFNHNLARPIIELLSITDATQLLLPLTVFFMMGIIISGLMRFILLFVKLRLGNSIGTEFSISIYKNTLYQPYTIHIARNSSEVIAGILSKNSSVIGDTIMPLLNVISSTLTLIFILSILVAIKPIIALTIFVILGTFYMLITFTVKKRVEMNSKRINFKSPTGRAWRHSRYINRWKSINIL